MQFWVELLIERVFETVQTLIHYVLSPFNTLKLFISWLFFSHFKCESDDLVDTSTLGDSNPAIQKQARRQQSLNTDGRTCEDVITALGWVASFSFLGCSLWIIASYQFARPRITSSTLWSLRFSWRHRYPYEALRVTTEDGYILLLERIPRYVTGVRVNFGLQRLNIWTNFHLVVVRYNKQA